MREETSKSVPGRAASPKDVRPPLDDIDRTLLRALERDARIPNNALAELAGIAPSTCLTRVRALRDFVMTLNTHPDIAGTHTSLIFEHVRPPQTH